MQRSSRMVNPSEGVCGEICTLLLFFSSISLIVSIFSCDSDGTRPVIKFVRNNNTNNISRSTVTRSLLVKKSLN